jgi:hypothetical protein
MIASVKLISAAMPQAIAATGTLMPSLVAATERDPPGPIHVMPHQEVAVDRIIHLADGRTLALQDGGDPAGKPVLMHPGTPG